MAPTHQEKLNIAEQIRSATAIPAEITSEMEAYLDRVDWQEGSIPTREGASRVLFLSPKAKKDVYPLYINIHGGGFVRGYEKRDTLFCAFLTETLGCKVIDIDYRLAPEHPFPAGLNECYDVVKWAFDNAAQLNIDIERVVVGGHSAGGNFTAAISLMANRTTDFNIQLQILDYPFLDAVTDPADKIDEESILPADRMRMFNTLYIEDEKDYANPLVSPVCASPEMLSNLPPALIIIPGKDCLRHEGERYARMLIDAGVEVRIRKFLESDHGFVVNGAAEYREARKLIVHALAGAFSQ